MSFFVCVCKFMTVADPRRSSSTLRFLANLPIRIGSADDKTGG